jgi:hypothetical protein
MRDPARNLVATRRATQTAPSAYPPRTSVSQWASRYTREAPTTRASRAAPIGVSVPTGSQRVASKRLGRKSREAGPAIRRTLLKVILYEIAISHA